MQWQLRVAHRLARINYSIRTLSFAFAFVVVLAVMGEHGFSTGTVVLGVLTLLVYPHLAYLHARLAANSKRAEFRNLDLDSFLMGLWTAQLHFALWPVCGMLVGVSLNNAVCGGVRRLLLGFLYFSAAALIWAVVLRHPPELSSGPLVTGLCFVGILGYVTSLGVFFHRQNRRLVLTRDVLQTSNEQFRFIAEHGGDLVAVLSPEFRFSYASLSHGNYFEPDKFAEKREWLELIHPEDRSRAHEFLESLRRSPQSEHTQLRMVPARGFPFVVACEGNPVRREGGSLQMLVLVCRDKTS
jgi:PAS domain-containing protein